MNNIPETNSSAQKSTNLIDALSEERATESNAINIPEISLPRGGGALKSIDEKFEVNAANGTASLSIPLPITPGRNQFSPSVSLSYNSGSGNSAFGLSWNLSYPSIQRKTDKRIPDYDLQGEDVFMFSGQEDLVPFTTEQDNWQVKDTQVGVLTVRRYRPRLERAFAKIERILLPSGQMYWKVTTADNVVTFYGFNEQARIADPDDNTRIFKWLPEFSYDHRGNCIFYDYQPEDLQDVPPLSEEHHRLQGTATFTNRYLKSIRYGNQVAYYPTPAATYSPNIPVDAPCFFELVFDYGEHRTGEVLEDGEVPTYAKQKPWLFRPDAFSAYRSGFEIRTYRRCLGVLMFHHFEQENNLGNECLVRSLELGYQPSNINGSGQAEVSYLTRAQQFGYVKMADDSYSRKSLPPLEYTYRQLNWQREIKRVSKEEIIQAPVGLTNNYQWVDLHGEGVSGILTEQASGWYYKTNLGDLEEDGFVSFSRAQVVAPKPSFEGLSNGILSLQDLESNGQKQLVLQSESIQGFFELDSDNVWENFQTFAVAANVDLQDPNVRLLDLNGDGKPEIVVSEERAFVWFQNEGKQGHGPAARQPKTFDEDLGPAIVFADQTQTIFLADMSGDGLTDIVRIRNGEVCYWANKGYGRFSAKVTLGNVPLFDRPDHFNPQYLHLADVSGTGTTDILYLGRNSCSVYLNQSGNALGDAFVFDPFVRMDANAKIAVIDLLGTGTSCIVWSSDLPSYASAPMRYIDLMSGKKPHVLTHYKNNLGKEIHLEYRSSSFYYLQDRAKGTPWITKLPFPVQLVSKMIVEEKVMNVRFSSSYSYHHGYYDHAEREFRGFGRVEQLDTESFAVFEKSGASNVSEKEHFQPPVLTKTWFHTGAFLDRSIILTQFKQEYWTKAFEALGLGVVPIEFELPDARVEGALGLQHFKVDDLGADEWREALRACKGMVLRKEVFSPIEDFETAETAAQIKSATPYSVSTHNCRIQLLQRRADHPFAVFLVTEQEAIAYQYEQNPVDPRITHTLNAAIDEQGNVLESVSIAYPRLQTEMLLQDAGSDTAATAKAKAHGREGQLKTWIALTKKEWTKDLLGEQVYQLRKLWQERSYELTGMVPAGPIFQVQDFQTQFDQLDELAYFQDPNLAIPQKRLIEHLKTKFYDDSLQAPLPDGQHGFFGQVFESYQLAYTPDLVQDVFTPSQHSLQFEITALDLSDGKFFLDDENWWIRSGTMQFYQPGEDFNGLKARFLSPVAYTDPFESRTEVFYDTYWLTVQRIRDALLNESRVLVFDYRSMSPKRMMDINDNISSVVIDELGLVKASAVEGKDSNGDGVGEEGDNLASILQETTPAEKLLIQDFFDAANVQDICNYSQLESLARSLLQGASVRLLYDFSRTPVVVASITREQHSAQGTESPLQISFEYSNGLGQVVMNKVQAEAGLAKRALLDEEGGWRIEEVNTQDQLRWVGSGRTVLNNKGNPIKQYEPYFSVTPAYERAAALVESGVTPLMFYDAPGRLIRTENPNGTFSRIEFAAWKHLSYDANDTVKSSAWYASRQNLANSNSESKAAMKAAVHDDTPSILFLDTLGRPTLGVDHNRWQDPNGQLLDAFSFTYSILDIEGNALSVVDARGNAVMQYRYDMLGHRVAKTSMDAGKRWMFNNVAGKPVKGWDERRHEFAFIYDALQRPVAKRVRGGDGTRPLDHQYERVIYGESLPNPKANNLRGQAAILYDTAGKSTSDAYDFKGNLLRSTRTFAQDYKSVPDWDIPVPDDLLEDSAAYSFAQEFSYDALNRRMRARTPDGSEILPEYNSAGLLERVVQLKDGNATVYVESVAYDAKGQRTEIAYGNGAVTTYLYDPTTFRLRQLDSVDDAGIPLQNLAYTYDPKGNITEITDRAIPVVFYNNQRITAKKEYTYDALYRLLEANGRERERVSPNLPQDNWNDGHMMQQMLSGDPMAMRMYTQHYQYDAVGNILQMRHVTPGGSANWTRNYLYEVQSNRLRTTTTGSQTFSYPHHDQHGFIASMPHLPLMQWSFKDELQASSRQRRTDGGTPEITYYVYGADGQRARKVTESQAGAGNTPAIKDERLYIGGYEVYRQQNGLERESLHIMDDQRRIAMIDTETETRRVLGIPVGRTTPKVTIRFLLSSHLRSASLELDETSRVIGYEEYHPFGTTAYQARDANVQAAAKRYRYTGMERDEETGLAYHSARYYLPWLGRWCSSDPIGLGGGGNLYGYSNGNPILLSDPSGTDPTVENTLDPTDPNNFSSFESYLAANPGQPENVVWDVWSAANQGNPSAISSQVADTSSPSTPSSQGIVAVVEVIPEEQGLYEQFGEWFRQSDTGQFIAGIGAGGLTGAAPGGFLVGPAGELTGASGDFPAAFRAGFGLGEAAWGIAQIVAGGGGEVGGVALDATGVGAVVGVPLNIASAVVIAEGVADVSVGVGVFMSAISDSGGGGAPSGGGGGSPDRPPSLKQQANEAGVREVIEDEFEVFAHGTTKSTAKEIIETEGGSLSASGGNFDGKLFTALDQKVAQEFAGRTVSRARAGETAATVGIALPSSVVKRLQQNGLMRTQKISDRAGLEVIFEPGAMEFLQAEGFFFMLK